MAHEQATDQPRPEQERHSATRRSGHLSGIIKRVNDKSAVVQQIDHSAWCLRSCRTSRGPRLTGGSGAAVAPHAVTFRDRVGRLRQFLIASGQIQMTASTRTRRKIEQPEESGMLA